MGDKVTSIRLNLRVLRLKSRGLLEKTGVPESGMSDAVLAEISLMSPRKLLIFIIKKYIYRINVPEKVIIQF